MWAAQAEADVRTTIDTAKLKGAKPFPDNPQHLGLKPQNPSPKLRGGQLPISRIN